MTPEIYIPLGIKLKGHFKLTAVNADTGAVRELAEFDNLIVNQGLDILGGGTAIIPNLSRVIGCCIVGTGTTPEAATDTHIQTFLAGATGNGGIGVSYFFNTTTTPYYTTTSTNWQFPTGTAAGNLTEIAMCATTTTGTNANPNAGSPAFSRTLIRSGGVPVTITVLSNEILNVLYTVQIFVPSTPFTGTFSLNIDGTPTTFNYSILPCNVINNSGNFWTFGTNGSGFVFSATNPVGNAPAAAFQASTWATTAITSSPSGTHTDFSSGGSGILGTYTAGTYTQTFQYGWTPSQANYASGLGGFTWWCTQFNWQTTVTSAINKTSVQQLNMVFGLTWSN